MDTVLPTLHSALVSFTMAIAEDFYLCTCVLRLTSRADLPSSCRSVPVKKAPCLLGAEGRHGLYMKASYV